MSAPPNKSKPRMIQAYTLDPDLAAELKKAAKEQNRSASNLLEVILTKWVNERKPRSRS